MSLDNDQYACKGCKKEFETLNSLNNHVISCKMFKERSFNCNHCEKIFILNNDELIELKKNGKIEIICPSCQAANSLDLEL